MVRDDQTSSGSPSDALLEESRWRLQQEKLRIDAWTDFLQWQELRENSIYQESLGELGSVRVDSISVNISTVRWV